MRVEDEGGERVIDIFVVFVFDNGEEIESGEDGVGQIDIIVEVEVWFVHTTNWVSSSDNRAPRM